MQLVLQQRKWNATELLSGVRIAPDSSVVERAEALIRRDYAAEYDSRLLDAQLDRIGISLSEEFQQFRTLWREDEWNHFHALKHTYSVLFGKSEESLEADLLGRRADFGPYEWLFRDEFTILVLLAYDEAGSMRTYLADRDAIYLHLGDRNFSCIAANLGRDEGLHFGNAVSLLLHLYPHRLHEVPAILDWLVTHEGEFEYKATFVCDHYGGYFVPTFNVRTKEIVLKALGLAV